MNTKDIKDLLVPFPVRSLERLYQDLPVFVDRMSNELNSYLNKNIVNLSQTTTNVADFVEQMKTLKKVDKKIGKLKDKSTLIGQICNIIDNHKGHVVLTDKEMPKRVKSYHILLLQNLSALDNAISKV